MRTFYILAALLVGSQTSLSAQSTFNPTGPASGFNVFTRSAVRFSAGDTHGPVATGGDAILTGSTIVSMNYHGDYPYGAGNTMNYGLVIEGRVWYNSGNQTQLNRGQVRIGNTTGTTLYNVNSNGTNSQVQLSPGAQNANPNIQSNSTMPLNSASTASGLNFATAFNSFTNYSATISNYRSTHASSPAINFLSVPPTTGGGTQTIQVAPGKVNYLNLSGAEFTAMGTSGITYVFSQTLDASTVVVFNVAATGEYTWIPAAFGSISDNSLGDGRFILYNFPTAKRIDIAGGRSTIGSILAPGAAIYKSAGNNAAGTIIADTLAILQGEVHYAPFAGTLPGTTPLPVERLVLSGNSEGRKVRLSWEAQGISPDDGSLQIERSLNGSDFERIANPAPAARGVWEETVPAPARRIYYRLRAADGSGDVRYSAVWVAAFGQGPIRVTAGPNPFQSSIQLISQDEAVRWTLLDACGQQVRAGICEGSCQIGEVAGLSSGAYILKMETAEGTRSERLVKQ